jgi:hypothetical protein
MVFRAMALNVPPDDREDVPDAKARFREGERIPAQVGMEHAPARVPLVRAVLHVAEPIRALAEDRSGAALHSAMAIRVWKEPIRALAGDHNDAALPCESAVHNGLAIRCASGDLHRGSASNVAIRLHHVTGCCVRCPASCVSEQECVRRFDTPWWNAPVCRDARCNHPGCATAAKKHHCCALAHYVPASPQEAVHHEPGARRQLQRLDLDFLPDSHSAASNVQRPGLQSDGQVPHVQFSVHVSALPALA